MDGYTNKKSWETQISHCELETYFTTNFNDSDSWPLFNKQVLCLFFSAHTLCIHSPSLFLSSISSYIAYISHWTIKQGIVLSLNQTYLKILEGLESIGDLIWRPKIGSFSFSHDRIICTVNYYSLIYQPRDPLQIVKGCWKGQIWVKKGFSD